VAPSSYTPLRKQGNRLKFPPTACQEHAGGGTTWVLGWNDPSSLLCEDPFVRVVRGVRNGAAVWKLCVFFFFCFFLFFFFPLFDIHCSLDLLRIAISRDMWAGPPGLSEDAG
jgi:hypothetical protein